MTGQAEMQVKTEPPPDDGRVLVLGQLHGAADHRLEDQPHPLLAAVRRRSHSGLRGQVFDLLLELLGFFLAQHRQPEAVGRPGFNDRNTM